MENLTYAQKILKEHTIEPLDGHTVVVIERIGDAGEEFRFQIEPGQRVPTDRHDLFRLLQGKRKSDRYFAFAVNGDPELRATFSVPVTMHDQVHSFHVVTEIAYRVAEPRVLVRRRNADPFRKLREELTSMIARDIARRDWSSVCDEFDQVETEVVVLVRERINAFAAQYGLQLGALTLKHQLRDADISVRVTINDAEKTKEITQIEGDVARAKLRVAAETDALRDRLDHDRLLDQKERENDLVLMDLQQGRRNTVLVDAKHAHENMLRINDAYASAAIAAIGNAGGSIRTPAELLDAIGMMTRAKLQMEMIGSGQSDDVRYLESSVPNRQSGIGNVTAEMFARTNAMLCPIEQRRQLQSVILHLLGEVLLDEEADPSTLSRYVTQLEEIRTMSGLPLDQFDFLKRFLEVDALRSQLL